MRSGKTIEKLKEVMPMSTPQIDLNNLSADQLRTIQESLTPRLNKYIPVVPTAKQRAFLLCNSIKEVLYGGA